MASLPRVAFVMLPRFMPIAEELEICRVFSPMALREAAQLADDDKVPPAQHWRDLSTVAFVTIDNHDSRDLVQAMHIERAPGGFRIRYALADASYFVMPGSALLDEALRRGTSYYFPGHSVPMLPRLLCEDRVSLNAAQLRRALVFDMTIDTHGECRSTELYRALIKSRAKLSYSGVQAFLDGRETHTDKATKESLLLLAQVGRLRQAQAISRDVVTFDRFEASVHQASEDGSRLVIRSERTLPVEDWNAQLSLSLPRLSEHFETLGVLPQM